MQLSDMAKGEPTQNLVIKYRTNLYKIRDVRATTYTHLQLLCDVSDLVLRDIPINVSLYITLTLPIPETYKTMDVQNDADLRTMFEMYSRSENIDISLLVTRNPPLMGHFSEEMATESLLHPNWLSLDAVRGRKMLIAEAEDGWPLCEGPSADLMRMAGSLRTQTMRSDGCDETSGFRKSDYKRDMRLHASIFKALAKPMASSCVPFGSSGKQQLQQETGLDSVDIEQWLNLE